MTEWSKTDPEEHRLWKEWKALKIEGDTTIRFEKELWEHIEAFCGLVDVLAQLIEQLAPTDPDKT